MVYRNNTIRGPCRHLPNTGGGGAPSQGGWSPATQSPTGPANHNPNSLANTFHKPNEKVSER